MAVALSECVGVILKKKKFTVPPMMRFIKVCKVISSFVSVGETLGYDSIQIFIVTKQCFVVIHNDEATCSHRN